MTHDLKGPWVTWDPSLQTWREYREEDSHGHRDSRILAPRIQGTMPIDPSIMVVTMRPSMKVVEEGHERYRAEMIKRHAR